jgi:hypothetical protein
MQNKTRVNLDEKISTVTEFPDLGTFCDSILQPFTNDIPTDLLLVCKHRRINNIEVKPSLSHKAFIEVSNGGFKLTIKEPLNLLDPSHRFLLAHEIAHTFQFELKSSTVIDRFFFLNGSKEQEYFSDYIARAMLIPRRQLKDEIAKWGNKLNSLKRLNNLITQFNVEYDKFLLRLFNDLNLFESKMIFRFVQFNKGKDWKLLETFASENIRYDKSFYIPSRSFNIGKHFKDRLPSCDLRLSKVLNDIASQEEEDDILLELDRQIFDSSPLKQIGHKIPFSLVPVLATTKTNRYNSKVVNILIDFENVARLSTLQNTA